MVKKKKILLPVSMQYAGKIIKTDLFVLGSLNGPAHGCHVAKSFVIVHSRASLGDVANGHLVRVNENEVSSTGRYQS
jgi:hypothetical protein